MAATAPVRFSAANRRQQIMDVALQLFARRGILTLKPLSQRFLILTRTANASAFSWLAMCLRQSIHHQGALSTRVAQ